MFPRGASVSQYLFNPDPGPVGDQNYYYNPQGSGGPEPSSPHQPSGQYPDTARSGHPDDHRSSPQPHERSHSPPPNVDQEFSPLPPLADKSADPLERLPNPWGYVAKEVGPSVFDIPVEEPPPQSALLDVVPTPGREKERGDSLRPVSPDSPGNTLTISVVQGCTSLTLPPSFLR